jgi:hypothetical protein
MMIYFMKLCEYIVEDNDTLKFRTSVPDDEWLASKRAGTTKDGRKTHTGWFGRQGRAIPQGDQPYNTFGSVTAHISDGGLVNIPAEKLRNIKGANAEQHAVRDYSIEWLSNNMKIEDGVIMLTKYEPVSPEEAERRKAAGYEGNPYWRRVEGEYEPMPPFIMVDQDGEAWVNEGNHRIRVALAKGAPYIAVEIRWYNGGERVDGPFSPEALGLR